LAIAIDELSKVQTTRRMQRNEKSSLDWTSRFFRLALFFFNAHKNGYLMLAPVEYQKHAIINKNVPTLLETNLDDSPNVISPKHKYAAYFL
jgi:hypothetical protein